MQNTDRSDTGLWQTNSFVGRLIYSVGWCRSSTVRINPESFSFAFGNVVKPRKVGMSQTRQFFVDSQLRCWHLLVFDSPVLEPLAIPTNTDCQFLKVLVATQLAFQI